MDPTVFVQIGQQPMAQAPIMLEACTESLRRGSCVLDRSSDLDATHAVAVVAWRPDYTMVVVEVGVPRAGSAVWLTRTLEFEPEDALGDRWRTVGFTIAVLVGDLEQGQGEERAQSSVEPGVIEAPAASTALDAADPQTTTKSAAPTSAAAPPEAPRAPARPPEAPQPLRSTQRLRPRLGAVATLGSSLAGHGPAPGGHVFGGLEGIVGPAGAEVGLSGWALPRTRQGLRMNAQALEAAVRAESGLLGGAFQLELHAWGGLERVQAAFEAASGDGQRSMVLGLVGLGAGGSWWLGPSVGVTAGVDVFRRTRGLRLHLGTTETERIPPDAVRGWAGVVIRPR